MSLEGARERSHCKADRWCDVERITVNHSCCWRLHTTYNFVEYLNYRIKLPVSREINTVNSSCKTSPIGQTQRVRANGVVLTTLSLNKLINCKTNGSETLREIRCASARVRQRKMSENYKFLSVSSRALVCVWRRHRVYDGGLNRLFQ